MDHTNKKAIYVIDGLIFNLFTGYLATRLIIDESTK